MYLGKLGDKMEIQLDKIETENNKLKKILDDFQTNYLNIYNELESISFIWQGNESNEFNQKISVDKVKLENTYGELKEIDNIYNYLINENQGIGKNIFFDFNKKSKIEDLFNQIATSIADIVDYYDILDTSFCPVEASIINSEKQKLELIEKDLMNIKKDLKNTLDKIEKNENMVSEKTSSIDIEIIKEEQGE